MSEKNEIARMGGVAQKNSGRGKHDKGDAVLGPLLVDIKEYTESFSVSRKVWAKLQKDAFMANRRLPALNLVLGEEGNSPLRLWVLGEAMFEEMMEAWNEKYGLEA